MAKPKKDGRHINYYLDRQVYEALEAYAEEKGQTMTLALERIVREYLKSLEKAEDKKNGSDNNLMVG